MTWQNKNITITKYPQSSFCIEYKNKFIYIDPFKLPDDAAKADYIFLTHEHFDHADPQSINLVLQEHTTLVTNQNTVAEIINEVEFNDLHQVEPTEKVALDDFSFETAPAYNIDKYRNESSGELFHPKENDGMGFILHLGKQDIYHLGDTDPIPELEEISDIDILLVPISGKYVMTPMEAVTVVNNLEPEFVIPMHHDGGVVGGESTLTTFAEGLKASGSQAVLKDLSRFDLLED